MSRFMILLENLAVVRTPNVVSNVIRNALMPIIQSAGRTLQFVSSGTADVSLYFDPGGRASVACGLLILGNEGGGDIWVGACQDLRVCGSDPRTRLQFVFTPNEVDFGRFVGNVAVHELGHMIAGLPHSTNRHNFMYPGTPIPPAERTGDNLRRHWAGNKSFDAAQIRSLEAAIRSNTMMGGMQVTFGVGS